MMVRKNSTSSASRTLYNVPEAEVGSAAAPRRLVPSFCSIDTILPPRPAHSQCRRAQRRSRMARLRATALAARSVLDGREHGGTLGCVGSRSRPIQPSPQKARAHHHQKPRSRSSYATTHPNPKTACRPTKAYFSRAASGWWMLTCFWIARTKLTDCSSVC